MAAQEGVLYHLGCGDIRLDGYVNVDIRETSATDITADLTTLALRANARGFFSHAFFEHLLRDSRGPHLTAARRLLVDNGFVCYLGLPDFRAVAAEYLRGGPGIVGPTFDLYNVYRYTHGDPEGVDYYFEQLHKSLFDTDEIMGLLRDSGFGSYVVFSYLFPCERIRVTLGFYATRQALPQTTLEHAAIEFLRPFDGRFLQLPTLEFHTGTSRSPVATLIESTGARRRLRPFARKLSRMLAKF